MTRHRSPQVIAVPGLPGFREYRTAHGRQTDGYCTLTPAELKAWQGMTADGTIRLPLTKYRTELSRRADALDRGV